MSAWTVFRMPVPCGSGDAGPRGCQIPAGEPVLCLGPKTKPLVDQLKRCARHAPVAVDWQEVELERFRLEADLARQAHLRLQREEEYATAVARGPVRVPRATAPPKKFTQIREFAGRVFDPKAAAAGARDD